jgi:hypothetical protein
MAKNNSNNSNTNLPNSNPKLLDYLKQPGQSAKPPAGGRS